MLVETFLRKQLGLKAHTVTKVEEIEGEMIIHIDRLGKRLLRCGLCRQRCRKVHSVRRLREWRDLSMRKSALKLRYRPRRVECPRCGVRVEDFPWAEPWARVLLLVANAALVAFAAWVVWFALLFTGTVRLDWLLRRLGQRRFDDAWTRIVFFTPPLVAAVVYIVMNVTALVRDASRNVAARLSTPRSSRVI